MAVSEEYAEALREIERLKASNAELLAILGNANSWTPDEWSEARAAVAVKQFYGPQIERHNNG